MKHLFVSGIALLLLVLSSLGSLGQMCPGKGETRHLPPPELASKVSVWEEQKVFEGGRVGMRIHVSFRFQGGRCKPTKAIAFFFYKSGNPVLDNNGYYRATDGQVAAGTEEFRPNWDQTEFPDLQIFIPLDELHLPVGHHDLKYEVQLFDLDSDGLIGKSESRYFSITK
jgi:hypothetical protein